MEQQLELEGYGPSSFLEYKMLSVLLNNLLFKSCGIFRAIEQKSGLLSFLALRLISICTENSPLQHPFFLPKFHFFTCLNFTNIFKVIEQVVQCSKVVNRLSSVTVHADVCCHCNLQCQSHIAKKNV